MDKIPGGFTTGCFDERHTLHNGRVATQTFTNCVSDWKRLTNLVERFKALLQNYQNF